MKTAIILVMCLATAFGHSMVLKRQKRSPCASPCSLTLNGKKYEITEGSNKVIHCNEWQCKRNSNGYCTASVVVAKCEKAEGSCVDVGTAEGCNKECVAGQYGMATWKYTKCKDSAGVCYEPDESKTKHCVTYKCIVTANSYSLTIPKKECLKETVDGVDVCKPEGDTYTKNCKTYKCTVGGPIRYVEDTSVPKQCYYNGSCLAKGDIRSCHKCKSDGTMEWKCKDSSGNCHSIGETWGNCKCVVKGITLSIDCS